MSSSRSLGIVRSLIRTSSSSRFRLADAAILSGGTLTHEGLAMGVPTLVLGQTADQEREAARLARSGAVLYLFRPHPISQAALRHAIGRLIGEPALRQRLSIETMRVVDGKGAERIVRVALEILHRAKS
jgi:spore coat polysaccharide biosynthesis predicted glycosyltransferase SpsG